MARSIKPNCRYGHGDLTLASFKDAKRWALITSRESSIVFAGNLYVCAECGYTEFFDDDPKQTIKDIENDGHASSASNGATED